MNENLSFEQAMARLAEITELLEANQTSLDQAMALFEEGLALIKQCDLALKEYETKINDVVVEYQNHD